MSTSTHSGSSRAASRRASNKRDFPGKLSEELREKIPLRCSALVPPGRLDGADGPCPSPPEPHQPRRRGRSPHSPDLSSPFRAG